MAHTPGPWWIEEPDDPTEDDRHISDSLGNTATVYGDPETAMANARLIAAAPELLKAVQDLVFHFACTADSQQDEDALDEARAAIAKAEGRGE